MNGTLKMMLFSAFICYCFGTAYAFLSRPPWNRGSKNAYTDEYTPTSRPILLSHDTTFDTFYFTQTVDHFDGTNTDTFKQRYLVSTQFWNKDGGPIFFYTGNEGDIVWFCKNTGFMIDIAGEFGAMLVFAEHRYYGKSLPYGKDSYKNPEKLSFLTSEQALEDYAKLITYMKSTIKGAHNSSVVAFGGSYGGMLAAWFRMKYAGVIVGSIAASAPIWEFPGISSCSGLFTVVTNTFKRGAKNCPDNIRNTWKVIEEFGREAAGLKFLTNELKMCSPLNTSTVYDLLSWLADTWFNLAMVDYPYPANFLEPLPAWPVKKACIPLSAASMTGKTLITGLAKSLGVYYNSTGETSCYNITQSSTDNMGAFGWSYQACTEMVMPLCTNGITDMFIPQKWNFTQYSANCYQTWKVLPRPSWITTEYWGKKIKATSNIVFSNGLLDPWSAGGVTTNISNTVVAVIIPEGAHHLDLRSKNPADPESVITARNIEKMHIRRWLKQG